MVLSLGLGLGLELGLGLGLELGLGLVDEQHGFHVLLVSIEGQ